MNSGRISQKNFFRAKVFQNPDDIDYVTKNDATF